MNMRRVIPLIALSFAILLHAQDEPDPKETQFQYVDVYVDSAANLLAAYQFEVESQSGAKIVGLEGGEHPAFEAPPHYDPAALKGGRLIVAAFNTGDQLPDGRVRVARLHLMTRGNPELTVKPITFATSTGEKFSANVYLKQPKGD